MDLEQLWTRIRINIQFLYLTFTVIENIEITKSSEWKAYGIIYLIWFIPTTISANDITALYSSITPWYYSIDTAVYNINCVKLIDYNSIRRWQSWKVISFTLTTSYNNSFFRTFYPFHYTIIIHIRYVYGTIWIDKYIWRTIKLIETITFSISNCNYYTVRFPYSASSYLICFLVLDVEKSIIIYF
jgi:hypothetical protein